MWLAVCVCASAKSFVIRHKILCGSLTRAECMWKECRLGENYFHKMIYLKHYRHIGCRRSLVVCVWSACIGCVVWHSAQYRLRYVVRGCDRQTQTTRKSFENNGIFIPRSRTGVHTTAPIDTRCHHFYRGARHCILVSRARPTNANQKTKSENAVERYFVY